MLLTYYSSTLRQKDLNFLLEGQWLNDQIMNFYYEYLSKIYLNNNEKRNQSIILLDPAVANTFQYCRDEFEGLSEFFGKLNLAIADQLIFLPMNDNTNPHLVSGGTHWSLLILQNQTQYYYLDSVTGSNIINQPYY